MTSVATILSGETNISFYTVPIAFVLAFLPGVYAKGILGKKYVDPGNPRKFEATIESNNEIDKVTKGRILRGVAAQANGLETIGFYAASVTAANTMGVHARTLNLITLCYLASRVLYYVTYVYLQDNRKFAPLRSAAWGIGVGFIITLFVMAQNQPGH